MMPIRGRARGGMMRTRNHHGGHNGSRAQAAHHVPFDIIQCSEAFPKVTPVLDDKQLANALLKRNVDLTPTPQELSAVTSLVSKIQAGLDALILTPESFEPAIIDEVRAVGSFKKGTMTTGKNVADLVILMRSLPTREAANALGTRLIGDLSKLDPSDALSLIPGEQGFDIKSSEATVRCLITTIPPNMGKLDDKRHLSSKLLGDHLAAIRHARWFEETATHSSVKVLVRLLKDLWNRYHGLQSLNPWTLELLAHHAIMSNPQRTPLPINQAFRRVLQLLASGIFLPGSVGIIDPCETGGVRCQAKMTVEQMDILCMTAQTLTRVLAHGGYRQILELEGASDIANSTSVWDGIVVTPSERVYEASSANNTEDTDQAGENLEAKDSQTTQALP